MTGTKNYGGKTSSFYRSHNPYTSFGTSPCANEWHVTDEAENDFTLEKAVPAYKLSPFHGQKVDGPQISEVGIGGVQTDSDKIT